MSTLFPKTINYLAVTFTRVKGKVSRTETPGTFVGSVQPVTGKDIDAEQVGRVDIGKVKIYSNTPLNVAIEGTANSGDIVIWQNKKWEVLALLDNQNDLINHYKQIAEFRGLSA